MSNYVLLIENMIIGVASTLDSAKSLKELIIEEHEDYLGRVRIMEQREMIL